MKPYLNNLNLGDVVTRPKCLGLVAHVGVAIGANEVLHNTPEKGEHVTTLQEFANGEQVMVHRMTAPPLGLWERVSNIIRHPRKYHWFDRNCEHTATEITHGRPQSRQLWIWAIIAMVLGLCFLMRRR